MATRNLFDRHRTGRVIEDDDDVCCDLARTLRRAADDA